MGDEARLRSVHIDEASLAPASREVQHDREVAIFDLLERNVFEPADAAGGPYDLALSVVDGRLAFDIGAEGFERRHLLSLTPFRSVIRDYFMLCDSYHHAIRTASPAQIEAIDMGRRGLHNDGSRLLQERLQGKVRTDFDTARRLFTLICALYRRT